jgi:hypothetical protein
MYVKIRVKYYLSNGSLLLRFIDRVNVSIKCNCCAHAQKL